MSTLQVDNIKTTLSVPKFLAHAWVNFDATGSNGFRGAGGVSSVTNNGTGDFTINFTNALSDNNYSVSLAAGTSAANGRLCNPVKAAPATTGCRVLLQDTSANPTNVSDYCFVVIHR